MSRMRHSTKPLPKDDEYLHVHQMPYFLEALQDRLRTEKPDDPLEFVDRFVKSVPKPKLVIKGPPASGKGTQCEKLVRHLGVVHISTGDLLRTEVKNGTSVGKQVAAFMKDGSLVPDELVIAIVKKRLSEPDARQHGWLLDGFPRTAVQARMMRDEGIVPQAVTKLEVPREEVVSRIAGRRVDPGDEQSRALKKRLSEPDARQHGWLLDGFPRTAVQARMMRDEGIVPQAVMKLEVPREEVVSRIAGRRVDPGDEQSRALKKRLSEPDARQHGWLLDGFPRTAVQARMMRDEGIVPQAVMKLEVSREEVVSRIAGRRVDPATNKVYHATHRPPPPGVKVIQRPDDTAEAIVKRYDTYMQNANEVLKEYSCPIYAIEGGTEDVAAAQILSKYQKLRWTKLLNSKRSNECLTPAKLGVPYMWKCDEVLKGYSCPIYAIEGGTEDVAAAQILSKYQKLR
ncbi:Adenylate kinase 5 [Diplonema papillatum]|nr:Adenylate kinase 5 [Diplonema papillatum]